MDDERLLFSDGMWHRGQRKRISFETACYYTHNPDLPHGCQYDQSRSSAWRADGKRKSERDLLLSLWRSCGGEKGHWRADDHWGPDSDPCWDGWYGVTCDEHGRVIALELSDNNLTGVLPEDLGKLSGLLKLDLSTTAPEYHSHPNVYVNRLTGALPSLKEAKLLEEIEVSGNQLSAWPADLFENGNTLRSLSANHNLFKSFPVNLRRFSKLHTLELGHNLIKDAFPPDFGFLGNARFVQLEYNNLQGAVGPSIIGMNRIRVLDLSHNPALAGELPEELIVEWKEQDYLSVLNTSMGGHIGSMCIDVPFCYKFMFDTHKDLTWATAADIPDIVNITLGLALKNAAAMAG